MTLVFPIVFYFSYVSLLFSFLLFCPIAFCNYAKPSFTTVGVLMHGRHARRFLGFLIFLAISCIFVCFAMFLLLAMICFVLLCFAMPLLCFALFCYVFGMFWYVFYALLRFCDSVFFHAWSACLDFLLGLFGIRKDGRG